METTEFFFNDNFPQIELSHNSKPNHSRNFWGEAKFFCSSSERIYVQEYFENKEDE